MVLFDLFEVEAELFLSTNLNAIKVMHQTETDYGQGNPRYTSDAHKDRASLP